MQLGKKDTIPKAWRVLPQVALKQLRIWGRCKHPPPPPPPESGILRGFEAFSGPKCSTFDTLKPRREVTRRTIVVDLGDFFLLKWLKWLIYT